LDSKIARYDVLGSEYCQHRPAARERHPRAAAQLSKGDSTAGRTYCLDIWQYFRYIIIPGMKCAAKTRLLLFQRDRACINPALPHMPVFYFLEPSDSTTFRVFWGPWQ